VFFVGTKALPTRSRNVALSTTDVGLPKAGRIEEYFRDIIRA